LAFANAIATEAIQFFLKQELDCVVAILLKGEQDSFSQ
jgi:hypothetical protein